MHFLAPNQSNHHEQLGLNRNSIFAELNHFILINCVESIQVSSSPISAPCIQQILPPPTTTFLINMSQALWDIDSRQWSTDGQQHGPVYKLYIKYIIFSCQLKGWKPQGCFPLLHRVPFRKAVHRNSFQAEHIALLFSRNTGLSSLHKWTPVCFSNLEYIFFKFTKGKIWIDRITQIFLYSSHVIEVLAKTT